MGSVRISGYTHHAKKRMAARKIIERDVLAVFENPSRIEPRYEGRTNYYGIAPNGRPIRVTVDSKLTVVAVTKTTRKRIEKAD